jgi:hypothetical protein
VLGLLCPRGGALWPVSDGQFGRRNSHQSQLFLWLSPPVQWIAHARVLPRGHGIRDRDRTSRPNQTRRAEGGSRVHLARVPSTRAMGKRRSSSIPAQKRRSVMRSGASVPARTPNPAPPSSTASARRGTSFTSRSSPRSISRSTSRRARIVIAGQIESRGEPILNPVTKAEHRVPIDGRNGFEFRLAEFGRGWSKATGPVKFEMSDYRAILPSQSLPKRHHRLSKHCARKRVESRPRHRDGGARRADGTCLGLSGGSPRLCPGPRRLICPAW